MCEMGGIFHTDNELGRLTIYIVMLLGRGTSMLLPTYIFDNRDNCEPSCTVGGRSNKAFNPHLYATSKFRGIATICPSGKTWWAGLKLNSEAILLSSENIQLIYRKI